MTFGVMVLIFSVYCYLSPNVFMLRSLCYSDEGSFVVC
jgi:hypothetical protein